MRICNSQNLQFEDNDWEWVASWFNIRQFEYFSTNKTTTSELLLTEPK